MSRVKSGGGFAAIWYTIRKSLETEKGIIEFWRRMSSRNACKTCAYGMGGQEGGMRNELGHYPEFCKKSVQAMAADMQPPIPVDFFERNSVASLAGMSSRELENLGRLAYPVMLASGDTHYRRIDWDTALDRAADAFRRTTPERVFFYSSGRSSNEAAFLLQWLARVYGTNNVQNCSYYCHQASGVGLGQSVGTSTATVTLDDVEHADFVMLIGANPASNHPRLITTLAGIRNAGGTVVVVNPLRENGLDSFHIPSRPASLLFGSKINDLYLQPRIGGDIALIKGMMKVIVEMDAVDHTFIERHTTGFEDLCEALHSESLDELAANCGLSVAEIRDVATRYARSRNAVFMWAMGITHHEHGSDNVIAIASLALLRGMVGRPNAGLMPIRGHSNVQGIGSVGFAPELKAGFLKAMEETYGLKLPTWKGLDSIGSIEAADRGDIDAALFLGGNFYASNPDLAFARGALGRIGSSIHISTKLNQGHVSVQPEQGETIILPTCVRDEELQPTTQESMFNFVRLSDGGAIGPRADLKSEIAIITSIGARLLPKNGPIDFTRMRNHNEIRREMARVVPGYSGVAEIGATRTEFHVDGRLRHEPTFHTPDGRARFIPVGTPVDELREREFRLMTIRSEGQFNTVVYEEHDRYRNQPTRDVVMMNSKDILMLGLREGDRVSVLSDVGTMSGLRVASSDVARGSAVMYYPEANVLVPRRVDPKSGTPAFKNARVRVVPYITR